MKKGIILLFVISLLLIFSIIGYQIIKEDNSIEKDDITEVSKNINKEENKELKQYLICSNITDINNDEGLRIGSNIVTYNFEFSGDAFIKYQKDILIAFENENDYHNYCLSCDNTEANDIKSITKGIDIVITPSMNKYIYEVINIDVEKYDGEFKETKFGLDGLETDSTIDDVVFMTRNMACYWKD